MGVELKSWYILAKEGEPSFRYLVTPVACASQDLFVVVPWALSNVLSGNPVVFEPYIETARFIAEYRNYWWQHVRSANSDITINPPSRVVPYPAPKTLMNDVPTSDSGNNFGRIARIKLGEFDDWVARFNQVSLLGINVREWRRFFREQVGS